MGGLGNPSLWCLRDFVLSWFRFRNAFFVVPVIFVVHALPGRRPWLAVGLCVQGSPNAMMFCPAATAMNCLSSNM